MIDPEEKRPTLTPSRIQSPWALIHHGGDRPGRRINSRLAYLVAVIAQRGELQGFRGYIAGAGRAGWSPHPRSIRLDSIIRRWPNPPTPYQLAEQKQTLPTVQHVRRIDARRNHREA